MSEIYHDSPVPLGRIIPTEDRASFTVLTTILGHNCRTVVSDSRDFILATSVPEYPVWIWTRDGAEQRVLPEVLRMIDEEFPTAKNFNVKYSMFEAMSTGPNAADWKIDTNMLAYECTELLPPKPCAGSWRLGRPDDLELLMAMNRDFYEDLGHPFPEDSAIRARVSQRLNDGSQFLWIDPQGRIAAKCFHDLNADSGRVSGVFTARDCRRHGYAQSLVYQCTKAILAKGLPAFLYTDGDYAPSNTCYMGIGFQCKGRLCGVKRDRNSL